MNEHYIDKHLTTIGSSVDIVKRCIKFADVCGEFEGVLDYADDDETGEYQELLQKLVTYSFSIIHKETK